MITEQTITDAKGYAEEYAPKVIPIIKANGGRYVARTIKSPTSQAILVPSVS